MGRALVEAEAVGVAVVATKVGGVPEVVLDGKTGTLVPPKDSKKLAEAVILLLKDKEKRSKMGIEARRFVIPLFGTEVMVNKVSDLYEEMLTKDASENQTCLRSKGHPFKSVIDKYSQPEELEEYSRVVNDGLDKAEENFLSKYFKEKGIVLDAGCGGGREAVALFKEGHKVISIDIVPDMLKNAKENFLERGLDIPVAAMDICNLGFKQGSFDYVPMVNHLISFIPGRDNRIKALNEIKRVLKHDGIIIVSIISRNRGIIHRIYWSIINGYRRVLINLGFSCLEPGDRFTIRASGVPSEGRMFVHCHTLNEAVSELESAGFEVIESRSKMELIEEIDEPFSRERSYTIYLAARK